MTGDELAGKLFAEQGYFVYGSDDQFEIGEIIQPGRHEQHGTALRVVGPSTYDEGRRQGRRAFELAPEIVPGAEIDNYDYWYHAEPVD